MAKKEQKSGKNPIPKELFGILACPLCRAGLEYAKDKKSLVCSNCWEEYPIKEGIPVLMPKKI